MKIFDRIKKNIGSSGDNLISCSPFSPEKMMKDPQVKACINIKKMLVLQGKGEIHPRSDSRKDTEIADFVRNILFASEGTVTDLLYSMLDAFVYGFSLAETVYGKLPSGHIGIEKFVPVNTENVSFDIDSYGTVKNILIDGIVCPREKLILYSYNSSFGSPYGKSDLISAYNHYRIKKKLTEYYNIYLEKYASPLIKGTYSKSFPEESQKAFFGVLKSVRQKTALLVPEDCRIESMNLNTGGGDAFQKAIDHHDRNIAKAILGQTIFTDDNVTVGSYSLANIHLELLSKCLSKIRKDMEEYVMEELVIKPLVRYNFGTDLFPRFTISEINSSSLEKNTKSLGELIKYNIVSEKEPWLRAFLGLPEAK